MILLGCLQLIPPGALAKFKLVLNADEEQSFVEDLEYIINGSQIFSLQLRAEIEPASLQLSAQELDFDFGDADSSQPWVQKVWLLPAGLSVVLLAFGGLATCLLCASQHHASQLKLNRDSSEQWPPPARFLWSAMRSHSAAASGGPWVRRQGHGLWSRKRAPWRPTVACRPLYAGCHPPRRRPGSIWWAVTSHSL